MSRTPVTWFEIGSDRPEEVERFYADLFGWTFEEQGGPGASYRQTAAGEEQGIGGAIRATNGQSPNYAIFYAEVADVAETCRRAEAAGGKVLVPLRTTPSGLTFAHLLDPSGNHIGVFTPPAAAA
ncbi:MULTISPECIES: VOC family protein [Micromonospora]|uniref:VOC family protein n=1 Tax=Micromonospora solifontis TaxID=2487138 RepID=A0ABX9WHP8_9ACTN|nr:MULTISPECIES: VOC family protein [Micromonospora]NES14003.1 VOC family protein [Micromonospora sp. PPF5-17B]NES37134.1 VOC family protein [Micromonospora solifontis]NES54103.1 VOC family protein [Micromonospora sp. PPF5-6]RNL98687.1 VOC family protein [Micromonospora solifontis]